MFILREGIPRNCPLGVKKFSNNISGDLIFVSTSLSCFTNDFCEIFFQCS